MRPTATMTSKLRLFEHLFDHAAQRLEAELDIPKLQSKYGAYHEQKIYLNIRDIRRAIILRITRDGHIERRIIPSGEKVDSDIAIVFRRLKDLLDFLKGDWTVSDIFSWDGYRVSKKGKLRKAIAIRGDWFRGSIMLKDVMDKYLSVLRQILFEENKLQGAVVSTIAQVAQIRAPSSQQFDEEEEEPETKEHRALLKELGQDE